MARSRPADGFTGTSRQWGAHVIPLGLLAVILALRIVYLLQLSEWPLGTFLVEDHLVYHRRALEILSGHLVGDSIPFYSSTLYPYLLAAIYAVGGVRPTAVYLVQHLLGAVTCALVFLLARQIFDSRHALIGLLMAGLYGPWVFAEGQILMISWTVFAVTLALHSAVRHARTGTLRSALLCGAACGLGMADKPNLVVLAIAVAIGWRLMTGRLRLSSLTALGVGVALFMLPVVAINAAATRGRVLISASSGINLAIGNNPLSDGTYTEPWLAEGQDSSQFHDPKLQKASRYFASRALGRPVDDLEADRYWRQVTFDYILSRPLDEARLLGRKVLLTLNRQEIPNIMSFDFYRSQLSALWLFPVGFWLVGPFGLLGAFLAMHAGRTTSLLPLALVLCILTLLPFFVCDRFRLPVVPILVVLAAHGMVTLGDAFATRRLGRAGPLGVGVVLLTGLVALPLAHIDRARDHELLAEVFVERGDLEQAVAEYRLTVAIDPDRAGTWGALGLVQGRLGRYAEAEQSLQQATQLSPALGFAHAALADLRRHRGAIDAALVEYRRATEADPSLVDAWLSLARLLQADGETGLARQTLLRGRSLNPGVASFDAVLREIGGDAR